MLCLMAMAAQLALAEEGPQSQPEGYERAEIIHRVRPVYPESALRLNADQLVCEVRVHVDTRGRATEITPRDCDPGLAQPTREALERWRWRPATVHGSPVASDFAVRVSYVRPSTLERTVTKEELAELRRTHSLLPDESEHCVMALTVLADSTITAVSTNRMPDCMVLPLGGIKPPRRLFKEGQIHRTCRARFDSDRGMPELLDLSACDRDLRGLTSRLIRTWTWNSGEEKTRPYELTVTWSSASP